MKVSDGDLRLFFIEGLTQALRKQKLNLQELTQVYLIDLLLRALKTEHLFVTGADRQMDEPLVLLFARALAQESTYEQQDLLRTIGDRSLYMSGFFAESFSRRAVDINYYMAMGARAYGHLSSLLQHRAASDSQRRVYSELAEKFKALVDLIADISEQSDVTSDQDLLSMYERWISTGSARLSQKLRDKGIMPVQCERGKLH